MLRRSRRIGMTQDVAGTVDARPLAVPDAEHAIEGALAAHLRLLGSPQRGCRQILIEPGMELDVLGLSLAAARSKAWSTPPTGEPR